MHAAATAAATPTTGGSGWLSSDFTLLYVQFFFRQIRVICGLLRLFVFLFVLSHIELFSMAFQPNLRKLY